MSFVSIPNSVVGKLLEPKRNPASVSVFLECARRMLTTGGVVYETGKLVDEDDEKDFLQEFNVRPYSNLIPTQALSHIAKDWRQRLEFMQTWNWLSLATIPGASKSVLVSMPILDCLAGDFTKIPTEGVKKMNLENVRTKTYDNATKLLMFICDGMNTSDFGYNHKAEEGLTKASENVSLGKHEFAFKRTSASGKIGLSAQQTRTAFDKLVELGVVQSRNINDANPRLGKLVKVNFEFADKFKDFSLEQDDDDGAPDWF